MQNSKLKKWKNRKFNYSIAKKCWRFLAEILRLENGAKECIAWISARAFQRVFTCKFGFDTAENEPCKVCPLSASPDRPGVTVQRLLPRQSMGAAAACVPRAGDRGEGRVLYGLLLRDFAIFFCAISQKMSENWSEKFCHYILVFRVSFLKSWNS